MEGKLRFEGQEHRVTVLNLPCVLESYQTYDDVNLVKTTDVGQVLVVGDISETEAATGECADGVTPPMRNARQRLFRKPIEVSPAAVQRVETQLLDVLRVRCAAAPNNGCWRAAAWQPCWSLRRGASR